MNERMLPFEMKSVCGSCCKVTQYRWINSKDDGDRQTERRTDRCSAVGETCTGCNEIESDCAFAFTSLPFRFFFFSRIV